MVIFQRELISTLLTWEPLFGRPRILDVDDAIWLLRRGRVASDLATRCDAVICGNSYLANYFSRYCSRVFLLPTGVDARLFAPVETSRGRPPVIGWSGTGGNLVELERIEPALRSVMRRFPESRLRVVCDRPPSLTSLPPGRVEYVRWTPAVESSALQDLLVGLMPLRDTDWARGKCALKLLTYMACGLPIVASPVGMSAEVLAMGCVGFAAETLADWEDAIASLIVDDRLARHMGERGREIVEANFSINVLSARFAAIISAVAG
ncbi:MAG: glycosyltransferase family 4 protein [Caulobacteraceae bacterium]